MDDLFRVIVLQPAGLPDDFEARVLDSELVGGAQSRRDARRAAADFLASGRAVRHPAELWQVSTAVALHEVLLTGPRALADVARIVGEVAGQPLALVAGCTSLPASERRVVDTLVATELVGDPAGTDTRTLAAAAQGYDVIRRAAAGQDPIGLRPLSMPAIGVAPFVPRQAELVGSVEAG